MKYEITEEMIMREFKEDEIPYRCARIETWVDGEDYPRQVGYMRMPEEIFDKVSKIIEEVI